MPRMTRRHVKNPNQLPLFLPDSSWRPLPASAWPDFRAHAKIIGVDTETWDPGLIDKGPGFVKDEAYLCGVSLASEDGTKIYLPLRHGEDNVEDLDQAVRYIQHQLGGDQEKCGANLTYDLESLWSEGIELKGPLADIQICEPLLDEEKPGGYSLEALAHEYLNVGKDESILREAAIAMGLDNPKGGMNIMPARFVGIYAEADAVLPIQIYQKQVERLKQDDVWDIFLLERKLQRSLFKMRLRGVRIDFDEAERLTKELIQVEEQLLNEIYQLSGRRINPGSSEDIASLFSTIDIPKTLKGNNSITNEWLQSQPGELPATIYEWRKTNKMRRDFIEKLVDDSYQGRIYSQWHQLREFNDESQKMIGTRSGRIASSKFNLTQVPSRDPRWGKMIRKLFIADEGKKWVKADYSQQEPRHLLHFAYVLKLAGAAEARQRYIDDPTTDYHQLVADLVKERSGKDIGRRSAKDINLGSAYGMGKYKLADKLGVSLEVAVEILEAYHSGVPYVKQLEKKCTQVANDRGYIRTILKRKRRFQLWVPANDAEYPHAKPTRDRDFALTQWQKIRRASTNKALNALVQGSAGDQIKKAIVDLDEAGLLPQIQVYDEINGSYEGVEDARKVQQILENAIPMEIPFIAEPDIGPNWADVEPIR